jgi:hypothetical protein
MSKHALVSAFAILLFSTVLAAPTAAAEEDHEDQLGNWLIWNGTLRFSDRWSVFTDGQLRLWEPAWNIEEVLLRSAVHYDITPKLFVGLGYLHTNVWGSDEPVNAGRIRSENRIYQQLTYRHNVKKPILEHRFRYEQRWIDTFDDTEFGTRFRYRIQLTIPLNNPTLEPGTNFVNIYNEFFVNNKGGEPSLEQNRLYAAWGRKFTRQATLQLGLLWQHRSPGDYFRLQVFYTHNFDFR